MPLLWLNGHIVPEEQATVPVMDRGLMLGDGLFETLRVRNYVPDFWDDHFARFSHGALRARIPLPLGTEGLRDAIVALCRANGDDDASVRITLTRGAYHGNLSIDSAASPTLVITSFPVRHLPPSLYREGIDLWLFSGIMGEPGSAAGLKQTAYLPHVLAKAEADDHSCYEALLCNGKGMVLECSTASFFGVLNGRLRTAPLSTGILPGITRSKLIEIAVAAGLVVEEVALFHSDLSQLSEAMIASSVRGAIPVRSVQPLHRGWPAPGPVAKILLEGYAAMIGQNGTMI